MEGGPDGRGPRGRDNFEKESKDNLTLPGPRGMIFTLVLLISR